MPTCAYDIIAAMFKGARHPVIIKDEQSRFVFLSNQACAMIGKPLEELVGKTDRDFLPPDHADRIYAMDAHVLRTGAEELFEEKVAMPEGGLRTFVTHKRRVSVPLPEGARHMIVVEIDDVTELRTAEQVLRASEEHHRSLIELHPQTPWVASAAGEIIEVGPEWEQLSGQPVASACGSGWMEVVHPEDLVQVAAFWSESVRTGRRLDTEFRVATPKGDYRWCRGRAAPRISPTGEIVRWYGLLEDVHDRRMALQALVESERRLRVHRDELEKLVDARTAEVKQKNTELARLLQQEREVNALQRRFVAMVSHEFRTPLTIIDAAAQRLVRLKEAPTSAYLAEKSTQIKASVARMVELMESILAAGRLETGVIAITRKDCSLAELVEGCVARRQDISPGHRIHCDLSDLPETLGLDPEAMDRVFTNLLSNAVKYAPRSPDIDVRGWQSGNWAHVSVQDHGIGMHAEDIPRLFEPYFRAQSASGIAGTGIGLNIVQEIVELHGGTITVSSEFGQGSTFTISLPLRASEAEHRRAA